ncbi:hypothetical protein H5085_00130 [Pseudoalteromonas sp. SR43-6]|uniref:hypothetical protein n=1 Tax=Pseudoalteromonas TaxID=53246 RepID=UPI0015F83A20|nr:MULTISPECIES: hypothetical protein [Pseudoalteromonas]MBB1290408.1 hypothetical protein [Pseudoalteromonas sp. SR41-5]MBB1372754.1 hypothetical protein [Pseudoalteromonas sp. SR43-6]MBB1412757.1 hypothetical protein [Pseudoalteromonas sp. SG43-8]MBD0409592.1 hypothetical protein [Pseudoalteromonas distincta]
MKKFYVVALIISTILFSLWLTGKNDAHKVAEPIKPQIKHSANAPDLSPVKVIPIDVPKAKKPQLKKQIAFNEDLTKAAQQVVMQYESALKFPPYSQPLSPLDEDRLKPNQFYPVSSPIDESGDALTVSLKQYRFVYPEEITIKVSAQGLGKVVVELANTDTKEVLNTHMGNARDGEAIITFKEDEDYPRSLQVYVQGDVDGKKVPVVAQIQYMPPSATLTGFEIAYAQNENMVMPANLTVIKSGLYRVRANLYSGDTPLAHLVSKERLTQGSQTVDLKAHWSVLPKGVTDMRLSDFVIERMSPSPGERNSFGSSEISHFDINDFSYDSLQQLPYQTNAQEKLSLEFLQGLAES